MDTNVKVTAPLDFIDCANKLFCEKFISAMYSECQKMVKDSRKRFIFNVPWSEFTPSLRDFAASIINSTVSRKRGFAPLNMQIFITQGGKIFITSDVFPEMEVKDTNRTLPDIIRTQYKDFILEEVTKLSFLNKLNFFMLNIHTIKIAFSYDSNVAENNYVCSPTRFNYKISTGDLDADFKDRLCRDLIRIYDNGGSYGLLNKFIYDSFFNHESLEAIPELFNKIIQRYFTGASKILKIIYTGAKGSPVSFVEIPFGKKTKKVFITKGGEILFGDSEKPYFMIMELCSSIQ